MKQQKNGEVIDNFHGMKIADPYRWLEEDSAETLNWVEEQNQRTRDYIDSLPGYQKIQERLTELWNYEKYSVPVKAGDSLFYFANKGLQRQPVLYQSKLNGSNAQVVIDVNELSEDGTIAISAIYPDKSGKLMAYSLTGSGSDWQEIKIRDLVDNQDLNESIKWVKFNRIAWLPDGSGFYYSRFPEPGSVPPEDASNYNKVYFHRLGSKQSEDQLIFEDIKQEKLSYNPTVTEDGRYLVLDVYLGTSSKNAVYFQDLKTDKGMFVHLLDKMDAEYTFLGNQGTIFYFKTDLAGPAGRIIALNIKQPDIDQVREIIAEQQDILDMATLVNNQLIITYLQHATHRILIYDLEGNVLHEIEFPYPASVVDLRGKHTDQEIFFASNTFLSPPVIYRYSLKDNQLFSFKKGELDFEEKDYQVEQVFYRSYDGTRIPMFLIHKKDLKLDSNNPTLLYGYGGFNISLTPSFNPGILYWIEQGGVYAIANLRGGGEYGEDWHRAGMLEQKQNVFDDFIAAAEWLIDEGYTNNNKLTINGRSNGGLLVAACMVQRPNLYATVICNVPVIDMLRYHKFTIGRYWIPEYGNPDRAEDFKYMIKYSPLHNIKEGVTYPPIIISTADTDDRVVPYHARKFTAALQEVSAGKNNVFLRVEKKAGHGHGTPIDKIVVEQADYYSFILSRLA